MAVRVNTQELDNTGIQGEGIITHCSFNSDGSTLAVSDREGNICLYQTNPTSAPSYLTEVPLWFIQVLNIQQSELLF